MSILSKPYFHDESAAYDHLEAVLWPTGPVCPHCGCTGRISAIKPNPEKRVRFGLKKCGDCKKQFTVKVGTVFEASNVKLHLWLQAVHLMVSSKKGISSHQLHRVLEVTYKTAWFMTHRIREAMRNGSLAPMGSDGGIVEVDETYIGVKDESRGKKPWGGMGHKMAVVTLVYRAGSARSFHVDRVTQASVMPIIRANLDREARIITDDSGVYRRVDREYLHAFVNHTAKEWGRGEIHTNTIEGFYSIFKRGMKGVYQHCGEKHLHRYLAEFDFRYSNRSATGIEDAERSRIALAGIVGKRLTYRRTGA